MSMNKSLTDNEYILYPGVTLGKNVIIEPYVILGIRDRFHPEKETIIGDDSFIGSRSTIYQNVKSGRGLDVSDQSTIFYDNKIGDFCRIGPKAIIKNGCEIDDYVRINAYVFLERVVIKSNVFIGPGTVFTDDMHPPCPRHAECRPKTIVESYVSIGASVTIAPGIKIGHHSQIYAGAVVIDDVEPYSVIAGVPGKRIKDSRNLVCGKNYYSRPFSWW